LLREASVSIQMSGVELTDEVPEAVEIFADPLIVKVFHNLVDNAVRHAEGVTQVRFSIADLQGGPLIICEDDGRGIGPEMREHLFERGFGKNHGLGLFLCREILSITGIRIEEEGAAGEGARFVMTPPAQGIRVRRNDVA
jgi:signal transduction histidine kinase